MTSIVVAYDLGTGGIKSSAFNEEGRILFSTFVPYETHYPEPGMLEQAPDDWWNGLIESTRQLLASGTFCKNDIKALAISGHSLGAIPIGKQGELLREMTPIWSDQRAVKEANEFFQQVDYQQWYEETGNGFPAACYSLFKIAWYKKHEPSMFEKIDKVIGTKDYCNYRLTGRLCTDYSYASGTGAYSLKNWAYNKAYIEAAGLSTDIFPKIIASDAVVGEITAKAARETGLPMGVKVIAGGVDNSCMALGAKGIKEGRVYTSLGSSAWIAVVSQNPVIDFKHKPYVFAHVLKGMYASATCIFSAGTSYQWVRNICCPDLMEADKNGGKNVYAAIDDLVATSSPGANGILFNPSLAGGSMMEPTPNMTGAFAGLKLEHNRADVLRATQEGIALNLRMALDILQQYCETIKDMLIVGGGAKSAGWMQIFADIYDLPILKTSIDQEAASLGAAALALNGIGCWNGYEAIDQIHELETTYQPNKELKDIYEEKLKQFEELVLHIAAMNQ